MLHHSAPKQTDLNKTWRFQQNYLLCDTKKNMFPPSVQGSECVQEHKNRQKNYDIKRKNENDHKKLLASLPIFPKKQSKKLCFHENQPSAKAALSREDGIDPGLTCRLMSILIGFFFFYLMFFYPSTDHRTVPSPGNCSMRWHGPQMTPLSCFSSTTMTPNKFLPKCWSNISVAWV